MTTDHIDLTSRTDVAITLMRAIAHHLPHSAGKVNPDFDRILEARRANGGSFNKVVALIDGVEVPLLPALEEVLKCYENQMEKRASERALEMVTAAGLDKLRESFEQVDWQLKQALIKVGATFDES